jgi:glycosyltransferase involved in cell wall biosynthesis
MASDPTLVSVVIPAYNAARVIEPTLRSVMGQTHDALDIVVVDDGSKDATAAAVRALAAEDGRIRLVQQANGGVCSARNRGIAAAAADYVALLDADDLWAPTKIEKQLARLQAAGPDVGLCYTQFVIVDGEGRITGVDPAPRPEGRVLREICRRNFVGHGSSPLIPKRILEEVGMFDLDQIQGCEDLRLYFRIAERYEFAVVQEPLVGYRMVPGSATSNARKMLASWRSVAEEMLAKHPECAREIAENDRTMQMWMVRASLINGHRRQALKSALSLAARHPVFLLNELISRVWRKIGRRPAGFGREQGAPANAGQLFNQNGNALAVQTN